MTIRCRVLFVSLAFGAAVLLAAEACRPASTASATSATSATSTSARPGPGGLDLEGLDRSIAPGDDFFAWANGGWLKRTAIPPDRSSTGTMELMAERTAKRTAELIEEAARSKAPAGSDARKVGDTYAAFLDEAAIEKKGLAPLRPALDRIAALPDAAALSRFLGESLRADVDVLNNTNLATENLFGLWVAQDLSDPSRYVPFLLQGGLGLPDREYYLDPSSRMEEVRRRYRAHAAAMLSLAGLASGPAAEAEAERIVGLERRIAEAHASRVDSEDVLKGNNPWKRAEFPFRAPGLDWTAFLDAAGLGTRDRFVVWQPGAVAGISALVRSEPLAVWKEYLAFRTLERAAPFLPKAFVDESFAFHGKVLQGTEELSVRWKRGVEVTSAAMGEAVGRLYVERYFPASEKARAAEMVKNELAAFALRIDRLEWMAPSTKAKAKAKLAVLKVGVGYPDRWRDYSGLEVLPGDALGNAARASLFEYRRNVAKLGRPVDRGEWVMNPQLVNAVNLPAMNAMNFPAAILQPPKFDPARPVVADYGAIGAVIGHEISHSFDDQGALFDAEGRLADWWTKEDYAHFHEQAGRLVRQYDAYRPFPDLAVNGKLTVSENLADVAGLAAAYDAYRIAYGGKEAPAVEGLSGDQQFFLAYAQSWRRKMREPAARQRIVTDGHAPSPYRVATVRNFDPWYAAFSVKPGQGLFLAPPERVRVW